MERPSSEVVFSLHRGGVKYAPSSPIPSEEEHSFLNVLKDYYEKIEEISKKIKANVITQLGAQSIYSYQTILLLAMDLETNKLKLSFNHHVSQSISYGDDFRIASLSINTKDITSPDKITCTCRKKN